MALKQSENISEIVFRLEKVWSIKTIQIHIFLQYSLFFDILKLKFLNIGFQVNKLSLMLGRKDFFKSSFHCFWSWIGLKKHGSYVCKTPHILVLYFSAFCSSSVKISLTHRSHISSLLLLSISRLYLRLPLWCDFNYLWKEIFAASQPLVCRTNWSGVA